MRYSENKELCHLQEQNSACQSTSVQVQTDKWQRLHTEQGQV